MKNFNSHELDSVISEKEINIDNFSRDELLKMISKMKKEYSKVILLQTMKNAAIQDVLIYSLGKRELMH